MYRAVAALLPRHAASSFAHRPAGWSPSRRSARRTVAAVLSDRAPPPAPTTSSSTVVTVGPFRRPACLNVGRLRPAPPCERRSAQLDGLAGGGAGHRVAGRLAVEGVELADRAVHRRAVQPGRAPEACTAVVGQRDRCGPGVGRVAEADEVAPALEQPL